MSSDHDQEKSIVIVPSDALSEFALNAVLEEFITREGTDYGDSELDLSSKLAKAKSQLQRQEVVIVYDLKLEQVQVLSYQQYTELERLQSGTD